MIFQNWFAVCTLIFLHTLKSNVTVIISGSECSSCRAFGCSSPYSCCTGVADRGPDRTRPGSVKILNGFRGFSQTDSSLWSCFMKWNMLWDIAFNKSQRPYEILNSQILAKHFSQRPCTRKEVNPHVKYKTNDIHIDCNHQIHEVNIKRCNISLWNILL